MLALTIAASVHISVLGAYNPVQLDLEPVKGSILIVDTQGRTESLQGARTLTLTGPARVAGPHGTMARFRLSVPGGPSREYLGRLEVRRLGYRLQAIVEMSRETAVAAIVEAEGAPEIPLEAQKAQAIVTRSYLAGAHNRHEGVDFCDTEHCQLLKGIAAPGSVAARATAATRDQILTYRGEIVPALYSANCGGHTKNLAQLGWGNAGAAQPGYPFVSVTCPLKGHASGHGAGMCQMGSIEIAKHGYPARIILGHYFPGTEIAAVEPGARKPAPAAPPKITSLPGRTILEASAGRGARAAQ